MMNILFRFRRLSMKGFRVFLFCAPVLTIGSFIYFKSGAVARSWQSLKSEIRSPFDISIDEIEVKSGVIYEPVKVRAEVKTANFGAISMALGCSGDAPSLGITQADQIRYAIDQTCDQICGNSAICTPNIFLVATVANNPSRNTKQVRFRAQLRGCSEFSLCKDNNGRCTPCPDAEEPCVLCDQVCLNSNGQSLTPTCAATGPDCPDPNKCCLTCPAGYRLFYPTKAAFIGRSKVAGSTPLGGTSFMLESADAAELQQLIDEVGANNLRIGAILPNGGTTNDTKLKFYAATNAGVIGIAPPIFNLPIGEGTYPFNVYAAANGCAWNFDDGNASWINVETPLGEGSGTASFSVFSNEFGFVRRSARVFLAGREAIINQPSPCASPIPISLSFQPISGRLEAGDCQISGNFGDTYSFNAVAGEEVFISLNSTEFDAVLELYGPGGRFIDTNNNGGGGTNARIPNGNGYLTLEATGTYTIVATGGVGAYDLSLRGVNGLCRNLTPLQLSQSVNEQLAAGDCRISSSDTSFVDFYSFIGVAGQQITITQTSTDFDAYLWLYSPSGIDIGQNDNGGGGTNARLARTLTADGSYLILANSKSSGQVGNYTLTLNNNCFGVSANPTTQTTCPGGNATFSAAVSGLAATSVAWEESVAGCSYFRLMEDARGPSLTLTGVKASMNGNKYRAVFNSQCSTATTAEATLTVNVCTQDHPIRVVAASGWLGGTVTVPIELVSQGDENALAFSLTFDQAILGNPQAALGAGASGASLNTNASQVGQGRLGIGLSLPAGQKFAAGARELVKVTFTVAAGATASSTNVGFGDQPIARKLSDVNAGTLPATYTAGAVTIIRGYEADVAPRPNGDNNGTVTIADWVQVGRIVSGLDLVAPGSEFQRADCAPRDTRGNGVISVTDWVQAGRYAAGNDPVTPGGGPSGAMTTFNVNFAPDQLELLGVNRILPARALRVAPGGVALRREGLAVIELDAQGDENAAGFSLSFDPTQLQFLSIVAGEEARAAALNVNITEAAQGRIGVVLALPQGTTFGSGAKRLVALRFKTSGGGAPAMIRFDDSVMSREVSNDRAQPTLAAYLDGELRSYR